MVKPEKILNADLIPAPKPDNVSRALALGEELLGLLKVYGPVVAAKLSEKRQKAKEPPQEEPLWKVEP